MQHQVTGGSGERDEPFAGLPLPDGAGEVTFRFFAHEAAAAATARPYEFAGASELAGVWPDLH
ncbi:MAG: hypothetical protein QOF33_4875 [Thermomicrobiales bacterium]|nr:hypothetical protein [Thermomicrobiales bacterium]